MNAARIKDGVVVNIEVHNEASIRLAEMTRSDEQLIPYTDEDDAYIGSAWNADLGFHRALAEGERDE